jgi:hypothetical protein
MARHNKDARGTDQRGSEYEINYQPDWLRRIKVTRTLESGRQSTKTLFRNTGRKERKPGAKVRTRIRCRQEPVEFEIGVDDPNGIVKRIVVETAVPGRPGEQGQIVFTIDERVRREDGPLRARKV